MDNPQALSEKIHVVVRDRQKALFEGDVKAITSNNEKGVFDILPEHINFLSIVKDFVTVHKLDGTTQEFKLPVGIIKVSRNEAHVYIGISSFPQTTKPPVIPSQAAKTPANIPKTT